MKNRVAVLAVAVSIAVLSAPGLATAAPGEVINGGIDLWATGKVVSKTSDSLVIRTDDHGHKITFAVEQNTAVPDDVKVGSHVRVDYHPTGSKGQAADKVTVTPAKNASR